MVEERRFMNACSRAVRELGTGPRVFCICVFGHDKPGSPGVRKSSELAQFRRREWPGTVSVSPPFFAVGGQD